MSLLKEKALLFVRLEKNLSVSIKIAISTCDPLGFIEKLQQQKPTNRPCE